MSGSGVRALCSIVTLILCAARVESFGCVDQEGASVDWWIAYKLPRLRTSKSAFVSDGLAYAYFTSTDVFDREIDELFVRHVPFKPPTGRSIWVSRETFSPSPTTAWKLANVSIADPASIAGRTLKPLYEAETSTDSFQLLYNDEFPNKTVSVTMGHTKGVVLMEQKSRRGFWLIHSVPHYPPEPSAQSGYDYPSTGHTYGQTFFCVSFGDESANAVGTQLGINQPFIYHSRAPDWVKSEYPALFDASKVKRHPHVDVGSPVSEELLIKTAGATELTSFAKSSAYGQDLYSNLVAPQLKVGLFSETWRHGGGVLRSNCSGNFSVVNVASLTFSAFDVEFSSEKDHAKWALSEVKHEPWVCIGDINRATTQFIRGGGTLCLKNRHAWMWFKGLVKNSEDCPAFDTDELAVIDVR